VFAHYTGLYFYDGASLRPLPKINALFNPESTDTRRINRNNIDSIVLGADATHVWFSYTMLNGTRAQFTYTIDAQRWTEESIVMVAHDTSQDAFDHIAAAQDGTVYSMYSSTEFEAMTLETDTQELLGVVQAGLDASTVSSRVDTIGHITEFAVESLSQVALTITGVVDDVDTDSLSVGVSALRRWSFIAPENLLGQRCRLRIVGSQGYVEIYSLVVRYTLLLDTTHFRSEPIALSSDQLIINEHNVHLIGLENGTVTITLRIDDVVARTVTLPINRNALLTRRTVIYPKGGRVADLDIRGSRFALRALALGTIVLSNGEQKYVTVTPRAR
jgi:hypothetical protein